ncbi:MAG: hypothetical protein PVF17_09935 [Ignavibacteria bacterium]|jgi:hypothetical protein
MQNIKFVILCLSILLITNLNAQQVSISPTKVWSNNYELNNPVGISISIYQPIWKLGLKAEFLYASNEREYFGYPVYGYFADSPEFGPENVRSNSVLQSYEFSVWIPSIVNISDLAALNVGVGLSVDRFSAEREGLSSGELVNITSDSKFGFLYAISIETGNFFSLPIKLGIAYKHKSLMSSTYVTDTEQPFVDAVDLKELQFSVGYQF